MEQQVKEKYNFGLALLAAILAFGIFKDGLKSYSPSFGFFHLNLLIIALIFTGLIAAAAYLFALEYLMQATRLEGKGLFKLVNWLADKTYMLGLLFPLIVGIGILLNLLITTLLHVHVSQDTISWIESLGTLLQATALVYFTNKTSRARQRVRFEEKNIKFKTKIEEQLLKTEDLYKKGFYGSTILEAYKTVQLNLLMYLEFRDGFVDGRIISGQGLTDALRARNLLTESLLKSVDELRLLRNEAAHSITDFNKNYADKALTTAKEVANATSYVDY